MRLLIIPAGDVEAKNSILHTNTLKRCSEGLKMWQGGHFDLMLLSGGVFRPPSIQTIPAAEIMQTWMQHHPFHPRLHQLLLETKSRDTYENVRFSLNVLRAKGLLNHIRSATVVTQREHAIRFTRSWHHFYPLIYLHVHTTPGKLPWRAWLEEWALVAMHGCDPEGHNFFARLNRQQRTF